MSTVPHPRSRFEPGAPALRTLYRLLSAITRAGSLDDVYAAGINSLIEATAADRAAILRFDDQGVMRFLAWGDLSAEYRRAVTGHTPWQRGERGVRPIVVPDVRTSPDFARFRSVFESEGIRALAFIPLALDAGVIGKFMLYYAEPHVSTEDELAVAQAIAEHVVLAEERKIAEAESRQYESTQAHLAAIVENSEDAIISKDLNGVITTWNKAAERMYGYTQAEAIGQSIAMLMPPELVGEALNILHRIQAGERIEHYETRRRRKNGQLIDVSLSASAIRDPAGHIVGVSKIARDISDRMRAEQERTELLAREQQARRTAEILNRVGPSLLAELDLQKLVQWVTDAATTLTGAQFGAFYHKVLRESGESYMLFTLSGATAKSGEDFSLAPKTVLFEATLTGRGLVRSDDLTADPKYGADPVFQGLPESHLPVRSYLAAPVVSRSGEVLGGLFFGHSTPAKFSEEHQTLLRGIAAQAAIAIDNARLFEQAGWAQAELKRSNEELRRSNQDLETFAYSASHDLQEPLRTIAISAQLLEERAGAELDEQSVQFLATILRSARHMTDLVKDLLAYTTVARQAHEPPPQVDARAVALKVIENMKGGIERANAEVTVGALPMVAAHEARLAQLFQNLIGNALKYRREEPPVIEISAEERDAWWVFSVRDNGIGIEPRYADKIFGLFKRLHSRERYPGSGIGLAICQRIIEQYGGRIWLETSTPGEGSTFCFSLPARR